MATTKAKQKTNAEKLAERRTQLDYFEQVELQRVERVAAHDAEHADFLARIEQRKEQERAAIEAGVELPPVSIPTLDGIMTEKREVERLEAERLEAERIAAIPARAILISALPVAKREVIAKWESMNKGQQFPIEALPYL